MPGELLPSAQDLLMTRLPNVMIQVWVNQLGRLDSQTSLVVVGDADYRQTLYQSLEDDQTLVVGGPYTAPIAQRLNLNSITVGLIKSPVLQTDEGGLLSLLDQGQYPALNKAFKLLWEARFNYAESGFCLEDVLSLWTLRQVPSGMTELSVTDSCDVLCLWLTLGKFNGQAQRVVLPLEDVASEESVALIAAAERWSGLGCPLGILLGSDSMSPRLKGLPILQ